MYKLKSQLMNVYKEKLNSIHPNRAIDVLRNIV